jgi:hypothetical protein
MHRFARFLVSLLFIPALSHAATAIDSTDSSRAVFKTQEVDGLKIFYREAGPEDKPTIVLLHGFPSSSHMFRDLIPKLAGKYHIVAADMPGYGYSDAPSVNRFTYTFDSIATLTAIGRRNRPAPGAARDRGQITPSAPSSSKSPLVSAVARSHAIYGDTIHISNWTAANWAIPPTKNHNNKKTRLALRRRCD